MFVMDLPVLRLSLNLAASLPRLRSRSDMPRRDDTDLGDRTLHASDMALARRSPPPHFFECATRLSSNARSR